jgi:tRNA (guanosine-2'-O-)-methyltransferase
MAGYKMTGSDNTQELRDYLSGFVTEERKAKFEQVLRNRTRHLTIVLEDIYQPHNASAVLRSCDCFGIQDVHIVENRNKYTVNPDIALGSSKWLTQINYKNHSNNTMECMIRLKDSGYKIIATSPRKNETILEELDITQKTALVFGTELTGISAEVVKQADGFIKIPMFGFTESFNISVSAALCMHTLVHKLHQSTLDWHLTEEEKTHITLQWLRNSIQKSHLIEEEYYKRKNA